MPNAGQQINIKPPNLGFGLGLRTDHYHAISESKPTDSLKVD